MTAVHLERRDVSFTATGSTGIINRWQPQYSLPSIVESVQLEDHNSSLVIPSTGLYLVYAQVGRLLFKYQLGVGVKQQILVMLRGDQGKQQF